MAPQRQLAVMAQTQGQTVPRCRRSDHADDMAQGGAPPFDKDILDPLRAALPDYFAALRISAPAAMLGGIIGEFIGGADNGLGVALISARANADPARVWGLALVATLAAGAGYALIALVGRLLSPWAPRGLDTRR